MRHEACAAIALCAAACGARTGLETASGGASSASLTAAASTSASTGGAGPCSNLVQHGMTIAPSPSTQSGGADDWCRLTSVTADGQEVVAAFVRVENGAGRLQHAVFEPWKAWPTGIFLAPVHSALFPITDTTPIAAGRSHRYSFGTDTPSGDAVVQDVDPSVNGTPIPPFPVLAGMGVESLASQPGAGGAPEYLAITYASPGSLTGHLFSAAAAGLSEFPLGCGSTQPPTAEAVPWNGAWLVAQAAGAPFGQCGGVTPDRPNRIQIVMVDPKPGPAPSLSLVAEIPTQAFEIVQVHVAPHPDGVFVAWAESDAMLSTDIQVARVAAATKAVVGPKKITSTVDNNAFAIAGMKRRLAIAHPRPNGNVPAEVVAVFDESLALLAEIVVADTTEADQAISAIGSPAGDSFVVCSRQNVIGTERVELARFDCAP